MAGVEMCGEGDDDAGDVIALHTERTPTRQAIVSAILTMRSQMPNRMARYKKSRVAFDIIHTRPENVNEKAMNHSRSTSTRASLTLKDIIFSFQYGIITSSLPKQGSREFPTRPCPAFHRKRPHHPVP